MERVLEKMAKQLNAFDEASLMALWQKYAIIVSEFEPSKRWEEAVLILSFIQSVRWKNQLFNYQLAAASTPMDPREMSGFGVFFPNQTQERPEKKTAKKTERKAKVLQFPPK